MRRFLQSLKNVWLLKLCKFTFQESFKVLPDNFNVAKSRLISLKRKLNSNPTLNFARI